MKVRINVTAKDIREHRKDILHGLSCPIHEAAARKFKEDVWVYWTSLGIGEGTPSWKEVKLPKSAIQFQRQVRNHHKVKPFSFTVNVPGGK